MPTPALSTVRTHIQARVVPVAADSNEQGVWAGHASDHNVIATLVNFLFTGTGTPEGVVTAPIGSLYLNVSGGVSTTLYVKTSGAGNTGWTAK
jgi:hypothetical protein